MGDAFEIIEDKGGRVLLKYTGKEAVAVIPDGVTKIYSNAFSGCTSLASVVIPEGVTEIGYHAFAGCTSLISVEIPKGVREMGNSTFSGCTSLVSVVIPQGVRLIGSDAFSGCTKLASVVIPQRVKLIGSDAFSGCTSLASVVIPQGVTRIGDSAFSGCTSLTSVVIPQGVKEIGGNAFEGTLFLSSLPGDLKIIGNYLLRYTGNKKEVIIPDHVIHICNGAFAGCTSLASVVIPQGVNKINSGTFYGCTSLTKVVIPQGVTDISGSAFEDCTSLTSVQFPGKIQKVGSRAFEGCSLSEIDLPDSLMDIDWNAFKLNTNVNEVNVVYRHRDTPGGGRPGFSGLTINLLDEDSKRIAKLTTMDAVTEKEYDHFFGKLLCGGVRHLSEYDDLFSSCHASAEQKGMQALLRLVYPFELDEKFKNAYLDYVKKNKRFIVPAIIATGDIAALTFMAGYGALVEEKIQAYIDQANKGQKTEILAYLMDYKNKHFAIPKEIVLEIKPPKLSDNWVSRKSDDGTLTITKYRGKDLEVEIPAMIGDSKVTQIGLGLPMKSVFSDHKEIQAVKILEGIQIIGDGAFINCADLQIVEIPQGVNTIGSNAFSGCINLKSVVIPQGVTRIGDRAFRGCTNLASMVIPQGVIMIGYAAFENCTSLKSVVIPQGVTSIVGSAFKGCTSLTNVVIPKDVDWLRFELFEKTPFFENLPGDLKIVGNYLLRYTGNEKKVLIPEHVIKICDGAFSHCTNLISVEIPEGVTKIGYGAFSGCTRLTSIEIPHGVTGIGSNAFEGCKSLNSVTLPQGLTSIDFSIFYGCSNLKTLGIPQSVTDIQRASFTYLGYDFFGSLEIHAPKGSYAIEFAKEYKMKFVEL